MLSHLSTLRARSIRVRGGVLMLAAMLGMAVTSGGAFAQGADDSYKGPPPASSFDQQIRDRGLSAPPAAPQPGGGALQGGGGLSGGGGGGEGLRGTQRQGTVAPIPIAIPQFVGDDPKLAGDLALVVASDLERSGLFQPIDPASYLEQISDINALARFPDWRQIRAEALVVGRVVKGGDGRVTTEFRLWDVTSGKQLAGQRFTTSPQNWRRLGHMVADQVYERLTGEKGYFDTRVVFVDETGPKAKRTKRLAIMDQDGANVRLLSQGKSSCSHRGSIRRRTRSPTCPIKRISRACCS